MNKPSKHANTYRFVKKITERKPLRWWCVVGARLLGRLSAARSYWWSVVMVCDGDFCEDGMIRK